MLKNNPAPSTDMRSNFYLKHFMNLLSEAGNGVLPISKVYEYADRWSIEDWEHFTDVIMQAHDNFRKELADVMKPKEGT